MSDEHPNNQPDKPSSPQEYRLVPVDDWQDNAASRAEYGIDVRELASKVWNRRWWVGKITAYFVAAGVIIALLSAVEYQADATLLPEETSALGGSAEGLLDQYGSLIGLGGGSLSLGKDEGIPPELYPNIVQSMPFQLALQNEPLHFADYDTTLSAYEFFEEVHSPSVFGYALEYTIGLPGKIITLFTDESPSMRLPQGFAQDSVITLTKEQKKRVERIAERVTVSEDDENGTIYLAVEMPDAKAASEMANKSIQLLRDFVTDYRIRKAEEDLEFARTQAQQSRQEWEAAQDRLATFEDQNAGQLTAKAQIQRQQLDSENELAFDKYNTLAQQVEQAKLQVQKNTPVVTVLQPVLLPVENYRPRRKLIVFFALFLGFTIAAGAVVLREIRSADKPRQL